MDKELVKQVIKEMIKDGDLQIEAWIEKGNYEDRVVTTIYYYDESMPCREVIQENKVRMNNEVSL